MNKLYYSIREVSEKTGVEPHVLRFWEKEFPMLRPKRGRSGNRFYRERDIKMILAIRDLRHNEKYTIKGALERLREDPALWESQSLDGPSKETVPPPVDPAPADPRETPDNLVDDLRSMLLDLRSLIQGSGAPDEGR
jgi:DNA-binding transcriptional MerR regulator